MKSHQAAPSVQQPSCKQLLMDRLHKFADTEKGVICGQHKKIGHKHLACLGRSHENGHVYKNLWIRDYLLANNSEQRTPL